MCLYLLSVRLEAGVGGGLLVWRASFVAALLHISSRCCSLALLQRCWEFREWLLVWHASVAARCCSLALSLSRSENRRCLRSKEEGLTTCFIILGYYFCWFIIPNAVHARNPCCFITLFAHVGASNSTPGRALEAAYQGPASRVGSHPHRGSGLVA